MQNYIYIPLIQENLLVSLLENWQGWTIITPFYTQKPNSKQGKTIAYDVDRETREKQYFEYEIQEDNVLRYLQGFIFEGDIEKYAPEAYEIVRKIPNIYFFSTNLDILTYLENEKGI